MEVNDLRRSMIESGARYLPVMDRDKLLGGDFLPRRRQGGLEEQDFETAAKGLYQELARIALKPARVRIALTSFDPSLQSSRSPSGSWTRWPGTRHGVRCSRSESATAAPREPQGTRRRRGKRRAHVGHPEALERSARYIEAKAPRLGLRRLPPGIRNGGREGSKSGVRRTGGAGKARLVVIGAHYDSRRARSGG